MLEHELNSIVPERCSLVVVDLLLFKFSLKAFSNYEG